MSRLTLTSMCLIGCVALALAGCASPKQDYTNADNANQQDYNKPESREHDRPERDRDMLGPVPAGMTRSVTAFPTGVPEGSGLLITKTAPRAVQVDNDYQYTIKATNLTDITLQDVVVEDRMPNTYKFNSASPEADVQKGKFVWELGKLAPGASQTITVSGAATEPGSLTHCATGSYSLAACVTTMVNQPELQLVKTGPEQVLQCDPIRYTITVTNTGTGKATGVVINDAMSDGMTTADGRDAKRIEIGTLDAGQSRTVTVDARAANTGKFTNSAVATANGGLEAKAEASTTVRKPELELTLEGPENAFIDETVTYTLTVKNTGDGLAANSALTSAVPDGATYVSATGNPSAAAGNLAWQLGALKPDQERSVKFTVRPEGRGKLSAKASADADCADAVADTAATTVEGRPAVLLEVVDENDPVKVGNDEIYTITVTNQGTAPGTNIKVVCTLEDEMQFVAGQGATEVRGQGDTVTLAPVKSLAPGAKASWKIRIKATAAADVRFAVEMTLDQSKRPVSETEATNFYK